MFASVCHPYASLMLSVCQLYVICMPLYVIRISSVHHPYPVCHWSVIRNCYQYAKHKPFVCYPYVTLMLSVCHPYVICMISPCYPYVTLMLTVGHCMSSVCYPYTIRMLAVCHSYVICMPYVCDPYDIHMWSVWRLVFADMIAKWNERNRALGHLCAHIG